MIIFLQHSLHIFFIFLAVYLFYFFNQLAVFFKKLFSFNNPMLYWIFA